MDIHKSASLVVVPTLVDYAPHTLVLAVGLYADLRASSSSPVTDTPTGQPATSTTAEETSPYTEDISTTTEDNYLASENASTTKEETSPTNTKNSTSAKDTTTTKNTSFTSTQNACPLTAGAADSAD